MALPVFIPMNSRDEKQPMVKFLTKKMTAACNMLPLGAWIRVTNLRNKKSVIVKINGRLHTKMKRIINLSRVAAGN
jgi:rare lipoprotein A